MAKNTATYRDFDLTFNTHPVTGDLVMKSDTSAVIQSVRNLILTQTGEFLFQPDIGGGIARLMFEPNDAMMRMQLYDKINNTIKNHESRIELTDLEISTFENGNGIYIHLTFYILNNPDPVTETIPIKRTR